MKNVGFSYWRFRMHFLINVQEETSIGKYCNFSNLFDDHSDLSDDHLGWCRSIPTENFHWFNGKFGTLIRKFPLIQWKITFFHWKIGTSIGILKIRHFALLCPCFGAVLHRSSPIFCVHGFATFSISICVVLGDIFRFWEFQVCLVRDSNSRKRRIHVFERGCAGAWA